MAPGTQLTHADSIALLLTSRTGRVHCERVHNYGRAPGGAWLSAVGTHDHRCRGTRRTQALVPLARSSATNSGGDHSRRRAGTRACQVACFDTLPPHAGVRGATFALPRHYADEGIKRYGFHGLSFEYVASSCLATTAVPPPVTVWRTSGAALVCARGGWPRCGHDNGRSPLWTGLVMGTRCGALDPGVLLHLIERHRLDASALRHLLYRESGPPRRFGHLQRHASAAGHADPRAAEAVDLFDANPPGAGLDGCRPQRARRNRVHGRHRRELGRPAGTGMPGTPHWLGVELGRGGQRAGRRASAGRATGSRRG